MVYYAGIDGGGTKTECVVGDESGRILGQGKTRGSNFQIVGRDTAGREIQGALSQALYQAGISMSDLKFLVLALSGADTHPDFDILYQTCDRFLTHGRYVIVNDTWAALYAEVSDGCGIISVCGTGSGCSGMNIHGQRVRLRNLTYEKGNRGGGLQISIMAIHYAFRSEEKTGEYTALQNEIPALMGLNNLGELALLNFKAAELPEKLFKLPVLICRLANEGDAVCQKILIENGRALGENACGVIKRLGMEQSEFPAILAGSLFKSSSPLMMDEYTTTVHRIAPRVKIRTANERPVRGALLMAMEKGISKDTTFWMAEC